MEYNDSFETWLHELEKEVDPCSLFPELCAEKISSSSSSSLDVEITANQKETMLYHQTETSSIAPLSSSEASLSFSYMDGNSNLQVDAENKGESEGDKWLRSSKKTALPLPQHIVVERKRRRELNQKFLALSKVVPSNKKKDRASILGEAVKYMEDLQERIKKLEEKNQKKVVESVVFVKSSSSSLSLSSSSPSSSSNNQYHLPYRSHENNNDKGDDYCNPSYEEEEIEAKVIERSVLIRVHCGNHHNDEILPTLLSAISELHLIVLTANAIPFGNHIDITVIAKMGINFCMKTKDIVENLRLALPNFI